jgi:hypothetical protein
LIVAFVAISPRSIASFITDHPVQQAHLIQTDTLNLSLCTPAFSTEFANRYTASSRSIVNGGGGKVKGAELALLQRFGNGFGFQGNYTYSDATAHDPQLEIPGNSKNSYNLVGFFENQKLGARLAYNLSVGVLRRLRSLDAIESGGVKVAGCFARLQHLSRHHADRRRSESDEREDHPIRYRSLPAARRV